MNIELIQELILYRYRYAIAYTALLASVVFVLFFQLGTLTPGISATEAISALENSTLDKFINNPINGLYQVLQHVSLTLFGGSSWAIRLPSALYGIANLGFMYYVLHTWHKDRIAIIGTLLMALSSWFLHTSRFGTDAITLPTTLVFLLALLTWFHHKKHKNLGVLMATAIGVGLSFYTPYIFVLAVLSVIFYRKYIIAAFRHIQKSHYSVLVLTTFLVTLVPLIVAAVLDANVIKQLLGLGEALPNIADVPANMLSAFGFIFWSSFENTELHLDTIAMLDIFTATMTALGLYHYEHHSDMLRTRPLVGGFFVCLFLVSLTDNQANYAILYPFIYVFAATGIITLLTQWYSIFPRNPFARMIAIVPISIVLLTTVGYHTNRYFIAWARNGLTSGAFSVSSTVLRNDIAQHVNEGRVVTILAADTSVSTYRAALLGTIAEESIISSNTEEVSTSIKDSDYVYISMGGPSFDTSQLKRLRSVVSSEERGFEEFVVFTTQPEAATDDIIDAES